MSRPLVSVRPDVEALLGLSERGIAVRDVVSATLQEAIDLLRDRASGGWPVDTGRSRAGLLTGMDRTANTTAAYLANEVPYAAYVSVGGRNAWGDLVVGVGERMAGDLEEQLADEVQAILYGEED